MIRACSRGAVHHVQKHSEEALSMKFRCLCADKSSKSRAQDVRYFSAFNRILVMKPLHSFDMVISGKLISGGNTLQ